MMQAFDWLESEVRSARRAEAPFDDWRVGGVAIADEFQCGVMVFVEVKYLLFSIWGGVLAEALRAETLRKIGVFGG
jgi:hypothetical protein